MSDRSPFASLSSSPPGPSTFISVSKRERHVACITIPLSSLTGSGLDTCRVCDLPSLLLSPPFRFSCIMSGLDYSHETDSLDLYFSHPSLPIVPEGAMCERATLEGARERWPALFEEAGPFANPRYVDF